MFQVIDSSWIGEFIIVFSYIREKMYCSVASYFNYNPGL